MESMSRAFLILVSLLVGCLPPPRAWPEVSAADVGADADADTDADADADDTGMPVSACSSIVFGDTGHLSIQASDVAQGSLYTSGSFSLELWAWFSDVDTAETYTLAALGADKAWSISVAGGDLGFEMGTHSITGPAPTTGWNHIIVVMDDPLAELRMYLNGALHGEIVHVTEPAIVPADEVIHLATVGDGATSWPSSMDELRFAHTVMHTGLSTDITDPLETADWVGIWHFDDLSNALTGGEASGTDYEIVDSCP
jgi:hypothetical protein